MLSMPLPFRAARAAALGAWLAAAAFAGAAGAAEPVETRGGAHPTHGRFVFQAQKSIDSTAKIENGALVVRFSRPIGTDLQETLARLDGYVSGGTVSPDGRAVSFPLRGQFDVRSFKSGANKVIVDLVAPERPAAQRPAMRDAQAPAAAAPTAASLPASALPASALPANALPANAADAATDLPPAPLRPVATARTAAAAPARVAANGTGPTVAVRSGQHQGYVRMVFEWPERTDYDASRSGDTVTLSFTQPGKITPDAGLPPSVQGLDVRTTNLGVAVDLKVRGDTRIRHFRSGNKIVVDIFDDGSGSSARPAAQGPVPPVTPAAPAAARPATPSATAPAAAPTTAATTAVAPVAPARPGQVTQATPETVPGLDRLSPQAKQMISPPPDARPAPVGRPPEAPTPAQPRVVSGTTAASSAPLAAPVTVPGVTGASVPAAPTAGALQGLDLGTVPPMVRENRPVQGQPVPVNLFPGKDGATLTFSWPYPVPVAVFKRGDHLWTVFDEQANFDFTAVEARGKGVVGNPEKLEGRGSVLRFLLKPGLVPTVDRENTTWMIRLAEKAEPLRRTARPELQTERTGSRFFIPADAAGAAIQVNDPSQGDRIYVAPVQAMRFGTAEEMATEEFRVLPSAQGIVIAPKKPDVFARTMDIASGSGIMIQSPQGLKSRDMTSGTTGSAGVEARKRDLPRIFPLVQWRRGEEPQYADVRSTLLDAIGQAGLRVEQAKRGGNVQSAMRQLNRDRLALAQFYFAHGLGLEALSVISAITDKETGDQSYLNDRVFVAMRGASAVLIGRLDVAEKDLLINALDGESEADLWRGALAAAKGNFQDANKLLRDTADWIDDYVRPVRFVLRRYGAEASISIKEKQVIALYLDAMAGDNPSESQAAAVDYLSARATLELGDADQGIALLERVAEGRDLLARSRAELDLSRVKLANMKLKQQQKALEPPPLPSASRPGAAAPAGPVPGMPAVETEENLIDDAIARLERLRFAWRGDGFELAVLQRLGELYLQKDDYRNGFKTLQRAVRYFGGTPGGTSAQETLEKAFEELFLNDKAEKLPPLTSIALLDEFRDLIPDKPEGDRMITKQVERLEKIDLLGSAATLLEHQIKHRLKGPEKAQVGARLARLRLLDGKPTEALEALDKSVADGMGNDVRAERDRYRAQALLQAGKHDEAVQLIAADPSEDAEILRADIFRAKQDWGPAADAYERLLEAKGAPAPEAKLQPEQSALILNQATALALAGEYERLSALRVRFGPQMAASPFAQAFNAISSVPSRSGEIRSIKQELADVQTFRTYLSSLRERPRQAQGQGTAAQGQARATGAGGTGAGQPPAAQGQARPPGQARPQGQGQGQVPSTGQPRPAQGQVQSQQRPAQGQVQGQPPARQVPNRSASAGPLPDPQSKARASLD